MTVYEEFVSIEYKGRHGTKNIPFDVPKEFLEDVSCDKTIIVNDDLELKYSFEYICRHCRHELKHISSTSPCEATLTCMCGEWKGICSPCSGSFYGGKVIYTKYTQKQLDKIKKSKIDEIEKQYDEIEKQYDEIKKIIL